MTHGFTRAAMLEACARILFENRRYFDGSTACPCPKEDLCTKKLIAALAAGNATIEQMHAAAGYMMADVVSGERESLSLNAIVRTVPTKSGVPPHVAGLVDFLESLGANVVALGPDGQTVGTPPTPDDVMRDEVVPPSVRESLALYVEKRVDPGDFLRAVVESNLAQAVNKADERNLLILPAITAYVYRNVPRDAQGSADKVAAWLGERVQTQ